MYLSELENKIDKAVNNGVLTEQEAKKIFFDAEVDEYGNIID